jgi:hypothetical protein
MIYKSVLNMLNDAKRLDDSWTHAPSLRWCDRYDATTDAISNSFCFFHWSAEISWQTAADPLALMSAIKP